MQVGDLLRPIVGAMRQELLGGCYLQADETTVGVQMHDGRGQNHQAYLWQYGDPRGAVVFDFRLGREREGPKRLLGDFAGRLQSDGYGAYDHVGGEALGVVEFFSRERRPHEPDLLDLMAALGSQLGQFIERKRAEAALRQAQAELAHVMRLTTVSELAASIAHEINPPLGAIVNNAYACRQLLAGAAPGPANPLAEALADIIDDAHRASAIIARVRALIKKTPVEKAPLDLGELLAEVLALAQRELSERRVRVVSRLAPGLPPVWGDRVQLQQVFLNLVINALEAMSAAAEARRVLTLEAQRDQLDGEPVVLVRVQDRGAGFGPGQAERLFEAFYTTKAHGLGMGLRISRSIVEAHAGRLWAVANARGGGATFLCALPARGPGGP